MNKLILFAFILSGFNLSAQEAANKKIQAGLNIGFGANMNTAATKRMEVNGTGSAFTFGLLFNYSLTNTIGFATGLDIDFEKNKIKPADDLNGSYYQFNDVTIRQSGDAIASDEFFRWTSREQKPIYLTLPTYLIFKTKFFGYYRFYGKFGLRTSVMASNKINDEGFTYENNDIDDNEIASSNINMSASRDMSFIRSTAGLSIGGEMNFAGSTSVIFEMGYHYGFTPIYASPKTEKQTLFYQDANDNPVYYSNAMTQSQLLFKIGLLF